MAEKALEKSEWPLEQREGLPLLLSPLLAERKELVHAFTTRLGGGSEPPLDSFNLGRHWRTEESMQDALANRARLCAVLGLPTERLVVPGQVHSTNVVAVEGPTPLPEVDAVATNRAGTPLLLHYADCVPVVLFAPVEGAVAVVHAGWRGTAGGIVKKAVRLLGSAYGSNPATILAAVGPAIGSCCYPTGDDVARQLLLSVPGAGDLVPLREGRSCPDLKAINAMQLLGSGVGSIDVASFCTACRPDLFYSHRASGGRTGRQGALACLASSSAGI